MIEDLKNIKALIDDDERAKEYHYDQFRGMISGMLDEILDRHHHHFTPDASKLLDAGYTLIRSDEQPQIRIKFKKGDVREWRTLEGPFPSKASRDRRFKELLNDPKTIEA